MLALAVLGTSPALHAQADQSAAPEVLKLERDLHNRMTVPVRIGSQGPFDFLIDTGSERTVLSREVATKLALAISGTATVVGVAGSVPVELVEIDEISLGKRTYYTLTAPLLDDQFIGADIVDDAMKRTKYQDQSAPIVIGVDPARFGADATVIAVRQGRDIVKIMRHRGDDTMTVVGHVIEAIEEFKPTLTVIDEGGLGAGIVDRLKEQRYKIKGVNFGNKAKNPIMYGNMRAQMWGDMREWLKTAAIPNDRFLKTDLISPMMKPDSKGTIFLESKKDMKSRGLASPDAADAIAVTFAFPVAHRQYVEPTRRVNAQGSGVNASWMGS
jgi:predicted aspartyl protease